MRPSRVVAWSVILAGRENALRGFVTVGSLFAVLLVLTLALFVMLAVGYWPYVLVSVATFCLILWSGKRRKAPRM